MATGKIKVNFKMPTPSAADRMHAKHQIIRKAAGLPDIDNNPDRPNAGKYSSGSSKPVKRVTPVATPSVNESDITVVKKGTGIKKKISDISYGIFKSHGFVKEEEVVVEMDNRTSRDDSIERRKYSPEGMARQDKEQQKRLKDISAEMRKKLRLPEPKKVEESFRIGGMGSRGGNIHMYGRTDTNPGPKDGSELENIPFHAKTEKQKKLQNALTDLGKKMKEIHPKLREAKDSQEYDYEGDMAKSDLRSIMHHAKELHDMIDDTTNLAEWCQSKITLSEDYLSTVANYMRSEMNEEVKKNEYHIAGKHKFPTKDEHAVTVKHTESGREHVHSGKGKYLSKLIKTRYNINHYFEEVEHNDVEQLNEVGVGDKVSFDHPMTAVPGKTMKKVGTVHKIEGDTAHVKVKSKYGVMTHKKNASELKKEEVELDEGRASQRHPLEGHEYHKKSNEALVHIAKDAHAAAEAMKSHNPQAENKYRDQANDSATVRHFRKTSGMPDWYKKKYGHVNEDIEQLDEKKKLPGLWANIHAKRKRGEAPAKPGDKDYPKTLNIEGVQDDPKADQMTTDDTKFPKKSRKAAIVKSAAKKMPPEDQFQDKPVLDSQVAQQTNK